MLQHQMDNKACSVVVPVPVMTVPLAQLLLEAGGTGMLWGKRSDEIKSHVEKRKSEAVLKGDH